MLYKFSLRNLTNNKIHKIHGRGHSDSSKISLFEKNFGMNKILIK